MIDNRLWFLYEINSQKKTFRQFLFLFESTFTHTHKTSQYDLYYIIIIDGNQTKQKNPKKHHEKTLGTGDFFYPDDDDSLVFSNKMSAINSIDIGKNRTIKERKYTRNSIEKKIKF